MGQPGAVRHDKEDGAPTPKEWIHLTLYFAPIYSALYPYVSLSKRKSIKENAEAEREAIILNLGQKQWGWLIHGSYPCSLLKIKFSF